MGRCARDSLDADVSAWPSRGGWAVVFCLTLAGCATRVPIPPASGGPVRDPSQLRVEDERGPLNRAQAAAALRRLERQGGNGNGERSLLGRHLADVDSVMSGPLVLGNEAHLLIDGPATQQAMLQAIRGARHRVDLETYLLEPGGMGEQLAALLEAKRGDRVTVRVLYDSVGSIATPKAYFERLAAAGVAVCEFNPVNPLRLEGDAALSVNNRNHRKVLVVDQRVAFTGGINISSVYSSGSFGKRGKAAPDRVSGRESGWRDTHVVVRGPVVEQFQQLFDRTWRDQNCAGPELASPAAAAPRRAGDMAVRLVAADPLVERSELYVALLSAIESAQRRVWLTYGYFVPDERILQSLRDAAARGVDVRLVLPGFSDFWVPFHAGRSRYSSLLEAGVRIFERRDALLHAKTAVIDGVWASVGSTNLDWRSFVHNYEADLVVLDGGFAGELEKLFGLDESASHEITADEWSRRGIADRFLEWFARRWDYLL